MSALREIEDIQFDTLNNAGIITLNRPKSLNALNVPIVTHLLPKLWEWEKTKRLVIIKGRGKAFCAGGDVVNVLNNDDNENESMIMLEYNINHLIGNYKIPYVALIDGITMGGGMGVSVHGPYRVATENTIISMPETKIGLIPDVGASYFLSRLPFRLGIYLGLTSNVLTGKDVAAVGIATHFVSSHRLIDLEHALSNCFNDADVKATLSKFHEPVGDSFSLSPHVKDIDDCFSAATVEEIIHRLTSINNEWSMKTIKTLRLRCPLALKLTLEALKRGAHLSLWQCLQMENRVCIRMIPDHNFIEGVQALLINKNNNPQWIPKTVEEVNESDIQPYFDELPVGELVFLSPNSKI